MNYAHHQSLEGPLSVRDKDWVPHLNEVEDLQSFVFEHSSIKALRLCSSRFPCNRPICRWCAVRRSRAARHRFREALADRESVIELVTSVKSSPSLEEAWIGMSETRKCFLKNRWLTSRSEAWFRQTEVTWGTAGWHVHDNWLIASSIETQQRDLFGVVIPRWLKAADEAKQTALHSGQHATIDRHVDQRVGYVTKGVMSQKPSEQRRRLAHGKSPGDILALYQAGDADAAEAWNEIENFVLARRRRWTATGGDFRKSRE